MFVIKSLFLLSLFLVACEGMYTKTLTEQKFKTKACQTFV